MLKKILTYILISFFITSSIYNAYFSIISFIASNLAIRESFSFINDVAQKGTHSGGANYWAKAREHKFELLKQQYPKILHSFSLLSNIDPQRTNFVKEYNLISLLFDIEKKSNAYKKETALYIPKTLDVYWNLSCDSHMPPFVAPAITNMAMIEGLPMRDSSCYSHFLDYGYFTYQLLGNKAEFIEMTSEQICERAKKEGFVRIIEINENKFGEIIMITHECDDMG